MFSWPTIRAALTSACCAVLSAGALANPDVEFDFSAIAAQHGAGSFSGSGGDMQYYFDGGQTGTGVGLTITGWQARSENRTFRNRTNSLDMAGTQGVGLDRWESGQQEAIDNSGRYDLIIFEFDELVSLDSVDLGWVGADFDMTLLAHTGEGDPTLDNGTFKYEEGRPTSMTSLGWELIGHYADDLSSNVAVNVDEVVSSFWAIGAYTSAIVDTSRTYGDPDRGDDYFRLRALAASVVDGVQAVAEPPVAALLLMGLLILGWRQNTGSGVALKR